MKVSDYIVDFLRKKGVTDCFMVVGGGAMFLDNSFGHAEGIKCTHFHHEQGAAIAAESYSRLNNQVAALCVTSGPGGTNAITGVLGGWLDSLPMFIVSGQVRYDTTVRYWKQTVQSSLEQAEYDDLRSLGDQEYDITKMTGHICKYAVMIEKPEDIRYHLEKAWFLMKNGRQGPVWLDVPVNYQNTDIEVETLKGFEPDKEGYGKTFPPAFGPDKARDILEQIRQAKRPVIYAGAGVRLSGGFEAFRSMVRRLGVPVCTYWDSIDLMEDDDPLYCGRGGNMGDRSGNFAIQNSDLLLVIGSRLSIRQVGYNWSSWAREARVIMVDIDRAEMTKHTIHVDERIWADARDFCEVMAREAGDMTPVSPRDEWREQCIRWKEKYPVVSDQQKNTGDDPVNVYGFMRSLSERLPKGSLTAVSNGACCVAGHQSYVRVEFYSHQATVIVNHGDTTDMVLRHDFEGLSHGASQWNSDGVVDHTILSTLYNRYLACLVVYRHVLVNHSDTSLTGDGNSHLAFGYCIHSCRYKRNVQLNVLRKTGFQLHRFGQHLRISGNQQDVVECQTVHHNLVCNK